MQVDGHQRTVSDVSTFYEAFLRDCASYIIVIKHLIFILKMLYIVIVSTGSSDSHRAGFIENPP